MGRGGETDFGIFSFQLTPPLKQIGGIITCLWNTPPLHEFSLESGTAWVAPGEIEVWSEGDQDLSKDGSAIEWCSTLGSGELTIVSILGSQCRSRKIRNRSGPHLSHSSWHFNLSLQQLKKSFSVMG